MTINGGQFTQDFRTQLRKYDDGTTRIGEEGRLWYNESDRSLRVSDGSTPGGIVLNSGGGGGGGVTIQDEGSALSTTGTTLNFVGSGVTATGTGATKTITISGGSVDLSAVAQDIIPDANGTRNLGSSSKRWGELFLSGETINLGGATISADGTGTVSISADGVTLPADSKDENNRKLAVVSSEAGGDNQQVVVPTPFFSNAGGLTTPNTIFEFNATVDDKPVFVGTSTFTLADGSSLTDSSITLFQF